MKTSVFPAARSLLAGALILGQAILPGLTQAQVAAPTIPVSTQFDVTGFIQAATLDPTCATTDPLCGGSITVNGQRYTVPRNTILQMPAAALTWKEVFTMAPLTARAGTSGLSLQDLAASVPGVPNNTYEAHVIGNRVKTATGDDAIAGLIFLAQHSLQSGQGYINWIDYATGEFRVGGTLGSATTGARIKINDPLGRFSRKWTPDARFTIDENNPTIKAGTGVPMCIPRTNPVAADDPWCPQKNRPRDAGSPSGFQMIFTMPPTTAVVTNTTPNPKRMVPFEIGDYVTYSGIIVEGDPTLIAAWAVDGNVGVHTALGDGVQYVATEVALLGLGGTTIAGVAEATIRTRFEGFTSAQSADPAAPSLIDIWGVDVDCANAETFRQWGTIDVDPGPPNGAVPGRWRFRPPLTGGRLAPGAFQAPTFLPATREVKVTVRNLTTGLPLPEVELPTADCPTIGTAACTGLTVNSYQAPIFEFLFPENVATGTPIVPNNFSDMPFLTNGSGPINGVGSMVQGTLSPWPGEVVPTTGCAPFIGTLPTASAGATQNVSVSTTVPVILTGTGVDPLSRAMTFLWTQTSGPSEALINPTSATASFMPTTVGAHTFQLSVTSPGGTATSSVTVNVLAVANADAIVPTLVEYRISKQRLTVTVADAALPAPTLTLTAFSGQNATGSQLCGVNGTPTCPQLTNLGGGVFTDIWVGVAQPGSVKISSSRGGVTVQNLVASNPIFKLRQ